MDKSLLDQKFASGELGDAAYVWNESFTEWKRVTEVPAFSAALQKAHSRRPSPKTHGVSSALRAIDSESYDQKRADESKGKQQKASKTTKGPVQDQSDALSNMEERGRQGRSAADPGPAREDDSFREDKSRSVAKGSSVEDSAGDVGEQDATSLDVELPESIRKLRESNRSPEEAKKQGGRQDRLSKLRQRLRLQDSDESPSEQEDDSGGSDSTGLPQESTGKTAGGELPAAMSEADSGPQKEEVIEQPSRPESDPVSMPKEELFNPAVDVAHADTLAPEEAAADTTERQVDADSPSPVQPSSDSVHDGLFGGSSDDESGSELTPELDGVEPSPVEGEEEKEESEDAVPFFPSAPTLEKEDASDGSTSISQVDKVTDSLLIQLDELKSDGRKQAIVGGIGALIALVTVGAVGYFGFIAVSSTESEGGGNDEPRIVEDGFGAAPDFSSFDREQLAAVSEEHVLEEQDLADIEVEEEEEEEVGSAEGGGASAEGDSGDSSGDDSDSSFPSVDTSDINTEVSDDALEAGRADQAAGGGGVGDSALGRGDDSSSTGRTDFDSLDDGFGSGLDVDDDSQLAVHEIDDDLGIGDREVQQGLSTQDRFSAQNQITGRVVHCRQRHYNRGEGELPADNIEVQFYVLPDGDIVEFEVTPASMGDTLFAECLERDTRHWNYFPRFEGNPERIVIPMTLD